MNIISKKKAEDYELTNPVYYIEAAGDSSEEKPVDNVADGSIFVETDTGTVFFYNATTETWVEQFSFQE